MSLIVSSLATLVPAADGRSNAWNESALAAAQLAESNWIRVAAKGNYRAWADEMQYREGQIVMASVFKRGGKSNRKGKWYIQWQDHTGKRQSRCSGTTDKATAERIAKKLEADAALRRDGVIDPTLDAISRESQQSIESHLVDFECKLRAANRTEKHVVSTTKFIRWIAEHAGFETAADISADGVNRYAGKLRDEGRSARTIQAHLNAITGFTKWLTEHFKLCRDPLASVKKPNPEADRRRERRMLLPGVVAARNRGRDGSGTIRNARHRTAVAVPNGDSNRPAGG